MSDIEKKIVGYIIKKKVGKGGMATLYQGTQESLNRTVAIKELHSFLYDDSTFIERFKREALTLSKLEHPNIVRIYEFIEDKKTIYIIMEFVKGIDLKIVINKIEQKMPAQLAMMFIYYILKGLGYAHDKGIIHRDIKPGNILVSRNGEVKLVDFGLAHSEDAGNLTMTGTLMGTPAYMSPEQARGETADNQSDIFSTGIMFYELLTGKKPYPNEKNYMSIISKILSDKPLPIPQLEPSLDKDIIKIYTKMVEKDKGKRYKNCNDIISDIEEYFAKYGIRPSEQLLKKYLISPSDFFIEYKKSQIEKGLKAGKEKFKEGREGYSYALTHFKNVLLWDTENAEAMGGIDKINAELSKGKISPFPIVLIALAAVALILYFTVFRITTTLSIDSNPSGAIVVLDESKLEKVTPISINVKPGTHSLAISKELYEDKNISIEIEKGEKKTLSYDLVRWNYQLATFDISPKNVPIFIDGKKVDGKKVKIPIGNHKILAKKDGFSTYEKNIQVFEGGLKSYKIVLRKIEDIFTIESNPPNATIYIDNNNAGKPLPLLNLNSVIII
jgi:serine/threonine protein kinase